MTTFTTFLIIIGSSALSGAFWWWVLWRIAALRPADEADLARRILGGMGVFVGIGTPLVAIVGSALVLSS